MRRSFCQVWVYENIITSELNELISFACSVLFTLTSNGWILVKDIGGDDDDALIVKTLSADDVSMYFEFIHTHLRHNIFIRMHCRCW